MIHPVRIFLVVLLLLSAGCSANQSVRHLPNNVWKDGTPQTLEMRYLSFQYQIIPVGEEVGVVVEAYPVVSRLPDWVSWYGEIGLSVYIADESGNVLASKNIDLMPRPLKREAGLPMEATFDLGTNRNRPLYVSFGYRLVLLNESPDASASEPRRALITEGALER